MNNKPSTSSPAGERPSVIDIMRKMAFSSPTAIAITAIENGTIIEANPRFTEMTGYSRQELLGKKTLDLKIWTHPEQRKKLVESLDSGEAVVDMEFQFTHRSGSIRHGLLTAETMELGGKTVILAYAYDITRRKELEDRLRQSEQRFSKVFHASPAWMVLVRLADMTIIDINTAAIDRFGNVSEKFIGRKIFETESWINEDARSYLSKMIQNFEPIRNYVIPYQTNTGETRKQLASVEYIHVQGQRCALLLAVDMTERLANEEQLEQRVRHRTAELAKVNSALRSEIKERKEAEEAAHKSETRFRNLVEQASDGILTFDGEGTILDTNSRLCEMVGYSKQEAIGKDLTSFIDAENLRAMPIQWDVLQQPGRTHISERVLRRNDGSKLDVEVSAKRLPDGRVQAIIRDSTERMKVEHERISLLKEIQGALAETQRIREHLAQSNEALRREVLERRRTEETLRREKEFSLSLIDNAGILIVQLDVQGKIHVFNKMAEKVTGYQREELFSKNWFDFLVPKSDYPHAWDEFNRLRAGVALEHHEHPILTKSGEERLISWRTNQIRNGEEIVGFISFGRDITEQKRIELERMLLLSELHEALDETRDAKDQLRELAKRLQVIREEERKHIAREIHDELGQMLTGLRIDLSWLENKLPGEAALRNRVGKMLGLIDRTVTSVQQISTELRPGMLDDLGLAAAIEWQANEFAQRTGLSCTIEQLDEPEDLDEQRSTALFRILQETLTNVARHAHATHIAVALKWERHQVTLEIRDDGKGIRKEEISSPKSVGLLGMKERALAFDGTFRIYGSLDKGTTVQVTIPTTLA